MLKTSDIEKEIEKLALSERLILVEDIWDGIARDNGKLPMPQWQKNELDKRYREYKEGKLKLCDWEGVHGQIRGEKKIPLLCVLYDRGK
ncbi:MAG: addiction module protein [Candidatus Omnitrophota bacterium]